MEPTSAMIKPINRNTFGGDSFMEPASPFVQLRVRSPIDPKNKFTEDFYYRIEEFMDNECLDIVMPVQEDEAMAQQKAAVHKLIVSRTVSESIDLTGHGLDLDLEWDDDSCSPSMRTIGCSTLLQRRRTSQGTLSTGRFGRMSKAGRGFHRSSTDDDIMQIIEEGESPLESRKESMIITKSSRKGTLVGMTFDELAQVAQESSKLNKRTKSIFMTPQTNFRKPTGRFTTLFNANTGEVKRSNNRAGTFAPLCELTRGVKSTFEKSDVKPFRIRGKVTSLNEIVASDSDNDSEM